MSDRQASDPELDDLIKSGADFQLAMVRETNRHAEANALRELGFFGKAFGGEKSAPTFVAMVAMVFGVIGAIGALLMAAYAPEASDFWAVQVERLLAFSGAALAFVFGRGSKPAP